MEDDRRKHMRFVQILPTFSFGDAIGNHVRALDGYMKKYGLETEIYASVIDEKLPDGIAKNYKEYESREDDIILYHLSIGKDINRQFIEQKGIKIINYHNITPPDFFSEYSYPSQQLCEAGLQDTAFLHDKVQFCIADSEYNKQDLMKMGYQCDIGVIPILIAFEDYKKTPDSKILKTLSDDMTNIIFVGRVAPNKKQEDIIEAFYYYKKYYNAQSRLILVGNYRGMENYCQRLRNYIDELGVEDVMITGQVSFKSILAYYHKADLFLCQSEHEGFCVPLVEAMFFGVPIVAYDSTAIGETMQEGGILLPTKEPLVTAGVMNKLLSSAELRNTVKENQEKRLKEFDNKKVAARFWEFIRGKVLGKSI